MHYLTELISFRNHNRLTMCFMHNRFTYKQIYQDIDTEDVSFLSALAILHSQFPVTIADFVLILKSSSRLVKRRAEQLGRPGVGQQRRQKGCERGGSPGAGRQAFGCSGSHSQGQEGEKQSQFEYSQQDVQERSVFVYALVGDLCFAF